MPKLKPKAVTKQPGKPLAVTVVGIARTVTGSMFTLSDGTTVETRLLETVGWCPKLREAPTIMLGGLPYRNEIPQAQRKAWMKKEIELTKGVRNDS